LSPTARSIPRLALGPWRYTTNFRMPKVSPGLRQADPERAIVLFEDRLAGPALVASGAPTPLLLSDGSAILEVLTLAQRLDVLLTP
jgi:hypothetical protein